MKKENDQPSRSEKLLSLADKLEEDGDKENALFLKEIASDISTDEEGDDGSGLNDNEMSLLQHKLKSALKKDKEDGDE